MKPKKTNVVIIDYQQIFRQGIKRIIQKNQSFEVLVSSDDYSVVPHLLDIHPVDVLLIDMKSFMHNKKNIKEMIINKRPAVKVIVMSSKSEENNVAKIVTMGAHGYLLKEMDVFSFIDAINVVMNGITYIHPIVSHKLVEEYRKLSQNKSGGVVQEFVVERPLHLYTKRECEVLQQLAHGHSNRRIAESLSISEKTVKNHVSSLFKKMKVNDRTQAVVTAIRNQWVEI